MQPIIYKSVTADCIVSPVTAHKKFDASFDNVPKSPSEVLLTALRACVHMPSFTYVGSESLFNPLVNVCVILCPEFSDSAIFI